jgi:hypothetical protein
MGAAGDGQFGRAGPALEVPILVVQPFGNNLTVVQSVEDALALGHGAKMGVVLGVMIKLIRRSRSG